MKIALPYPPAACSPNARNLWAGIRARKKYRHDCGIEAIAQGLRKMDAKTVHVTLTFHPPDKRRRDADNAIASFKSGADAIADVIGIDDSKWTWGAPTWGPVWVPGYVEVEIT